MTTCATGWATWSGIIVIRPTKSSTATGLAPREIDAALKRFDIRPETKPKRPADAPLLALPYPGGRHPRIGFLDGAVQPQRETKISVFTPWDDASYVVADVPEAIWSNLGLTYLAHTHVPTIWTKQNVELDRLEWRRHDDGTLDIERKLPNGIAFAVKVRPRRDAVRLDMSLTNGTSEKLTDLRVQMCLMLKGAAGFAKQTNDNKVFEPPYTACRSDDGRRWIIWAWEQVPPAVGQSAVPVPALRSRSSLTARRGETQRLRGWLSFYEGKDLQGELRRIESTKWHED